MTPRKSIFRDCSLRGVFCYVSPFVLRRFLYAICYGVFALPSLGLAWRFSPPAPGTFTLSCAPVRPVSNASHSFLYWTNNPGLLQSGYVTGNSNVYGHVYGPYSLPNIGYSQGAFVTSAFSFFAYPSNALYTFYVPGSAGSNAFPGRVDLAWTAPQFGSFGHPYYNDVFPAWFSNMVQVGFTDHVSYATVTYYSNADDGANVVLSTNSAYGLSVFHDVGPNQVNSAPYWNPYGPAQRQMSASPGISNYYLVDFHPAPFYYNLEQGVQWVSQSSGVWSTNYEDLYNTYNRLFGAVAGPQSWPFSYYVDDSNIRLPGAFRNYAALFTFTTATAFSDQYFAVSGASATLRFTNDISGVFSNSFVGYSATLWTSNFYVTALYVGSYYPYYTNALVHEDFITISPTNLLVYPEPGDLVPAWYGYSDSGGLHGAWPGAISFWQNQGGWVTPTNGGN